MQSLWTPNDRNDGKMAQFAVCFGAKQTFGNYCMTNVLVTMIYLKKKIKYVGNLESDAKYAFRSLKLWRTP